jgi:glutamine phosphoribosylpyrophosphate amidotransferase
MCRMIAATGGFDPGGMVLALRAMAANTNTAHTHEKRTFGEAYRHEDGWGAAWVTGDALRVRRSIRSCLTDDHFMEAAEISTDLLILHARRASKSGTVSLENTHPFLAMHGGRQWAFAHNGTVHALGSLRPAMGLVPGGNMDSELLFHHVLNYLDDSDPPGSLIGSFDPITDYTALMVLLASPEAIIAASKRHPTQGLEHYHALWEGRGPGLHVVSSERVDGIGCAEWKKVPDGGFVTLRRGP